MSDRITKFRAWNKKEKRMVYDDEDSIKISLQGLLSYMGVGLDTELRYEIMQFTGLKDKNKNEIYEGDIVKYDDSPDETEGTPFKTCFIEKIEFRNGGFGFNENTWDYWENEFSYEIEYLKIIGNVYENKELLKEAK